MIHLSFFFDNVVPFSFLFVLSMDTLQFYGKQVLTTNEHMHTQHEILKKKKTSLFHDKNVSNVESIDLKRECLIYIRIYVSVLYAKSLVFKGLSC